MTKNTIDFIKIKDGKSEWLGANQYWFNQKFAALSGCGPTTASEILAFLAKKYPSIMRGIHPEGFGPLERKEFVRFMQEVRAFVKPGVMGLTDINFYTDQTINYAESRGIRLTAKQIDAGESTEAAFREVTAVIDNGLPLALLILSNPHPDIREYTWHWMTIIGYDKKESTITVATHGRAHVLRFNNVWVNSGGHKTGIVHFLPEGA